MYIGMYKKKFVSAVFCSIIKGYLRESRQEISHDYSNCSHTFLLLSSSILQGDCINVLSYIPGGELKFEAAC